MTGRQRTRPGRRGSRVLTAVAAAGALAVLTAGPAAAHVLIETVEPHGDGTSTLTFTFDHGCDGERAAFTLDVRVTGVVGQAFVFPAEQECPSGASYAWTDTDPSGARPAPTFVATTASLAPAPVVAGASPTPTAPLVAAVVVGAAVVGVAGGWSARRRLRTT